MQNLSANEEQKNGLSLPGITNSAFTTPTALYKGIPINGETEDTPLPLSHYIRLLRRRLWKICGFVLVTVLGVLVISLNLTPVYESTATIDIDRQTSAEIIGRDAINSQLTDADQFLATQINLIQSDSVLRPVAVKYGLLKHDKDDQRSHSDPGPARTDEPITLPSLNVFRPPNTYLLKISYRSPNPVLAAKLLGKTVPLSGPAQ